MKETEGCGISIGVLGQESWRQSKRHEEEGGVKRVVETHSDLVLLYLELFLGLAKVSTNEYSECAFICSQPSAFSMLEA